MGCSRIYWKKCKDIWNKQDAMSPGEQTLAHMKILNPALHDVFNSKNKFDSTQIKIIDESLFDVCCLEHMAHMTIIHLENLMNRRKQVTSNDIEKYNYS